MSLERFDIPPLVYISTVILAGTVACAPFTAIQEEVTKKMQSHGLFKDESSLKEQDDSSLEIKEADLSLHQGELDIAESELNKLELTALEKGIIGDKKTEELTRDDFIELGQAYMKRVKRLPDLNLKPNYEKRYAFLRNLFLFSKVPLLTFAEFEKEVIQAKCPVLVYFYREENDKDPLLYNLINEYAGRVKIVRLKFKDFFEEGEKCTPEEEKEIEQASNMRIEYKLHFIAPSLGIFQGGKMITAADWPDWKTRETRHEDLNWRIEQFLETGKVKGAEEITDDNLKEILAISDKEPIFIDISTEGCFPCYLISNDIDDLSREFKGQIKVYKAEASRSKNEKLNEFLKKITCSYPTLIVYFKGQHYKLKKRDSITGTWQWTDDPQSFKDLRTELKKLLQELKSKKNPS